MDAQTLSEAWRPVPGYEGLYEVSDHGRVRSVERRTWLVNRWGQDMERIVPERIRALSTDKDGYLKVTLHKEGRRTPRHVHSLVLDAFVGPRPEGLEVRHLDGNPENNTPRNLRYGTGAENAGDMIRHGRHRNKRKTVCKHGHLFDAENTYIRLDGNRDCRTCAKARHPREVNTAYMRGYRARKRSAANPVAE